VTESKSSRDQKLLEARVVRNKCSQEGKKSQLNSTVVNFEGLGQSLKGIRRVGDPRKVGYRPLSLPRSCNCARLIFPTTPNLSRCSSISNLPSIASHSLGGIYRWYTITIIHANKRAKRSHRDNAKITNFFSPTHEKKPRFDSIIEPSQPPTSNAICPNDESTVLGDNGLSGLNHASKQPPLTRNAICPDTQIR
jgi:hypothetical protein